MNEMKNVTTGIKVLVARGGKKYEGEYVRPFGERMPTQHLVKVRYADDVAPRIHRVSFTAINLAPAPAKKVKAKVAVKKPAPVVTPKAEPAPKKGVVRTEDRFKSAALIAEGKKGGRWFLTSGLYTAKAGIVTNTKTGKEYKILDTARVGDVIHISVEVNGARGLIVSDPLTHESLTRWGIKATA